MDRPYGENVKIVKIPVAWKMFNSEALFLQGDKERQGEIAAKREAQETEGRRELQKWLDEGYRVISSHVLDTSVGAFIVYTLYDDGGN